MTLRLMEPNRQIRTVSIAHHYRFPYIPQLVIPDTGKQIQEFRETLLLCEETHFSNMDIGTMLEEIIIYISFLDNAREGLDQLYTDVLTCHGRDVGYGDSERIADAVMNLGEGLLSFFKAWNLYLGEDNILPYGFTNKWADPLHPIMEKQFGHFPSFLYLGEQY